MKKLFLLLVFASFLYACKNETANETNSPTPANPSNTAPSAPITSDPATSPSLESMRSSALQESDTLGRLRQSFIALQEEFNKSKGIVPDVGDVTVSVDEKLNLRIENKLNGHTYLSVVKVADLQRRNNGILLLPDFHPRKHPGLKIKVKEGRPKVQLFIDGKFDKEMEYIEFSLKDRPSMERVVPAIVQAMNISNGMPERSN
ncbi:MAG: hypothetical protein IPN76_09985 [Saprospiraceae bacterium]|nr:hypothetical protein [Saprospiraceae bacterium]